MNKLLIAIVFLGCFLLSCNSKKSKNVKQKEHNKDKISTDLNLETVINDTVIQVPHKTGLIKVYLQSHTSDQLKGTLVLLPGWNFPALDWCSKTDFCKKAKELGYQLIMPEMQKSMYAKHSFKETRTDLKNVLSRVWFKDTLVKYLQDSMKLLLPNQINGVCGISSGARGAALVAMDLPKVFKVAVALSGDFNPSLLQSDNLMNLFYGKFLQHKQRWLENDNVYSAASSYQVPILLLHGAQDNVVSVNQSTSFYNELKRVNPSLKCELIIDSTAGHNYSYWGKQTGKILSFIDNTCKMKRKNGIQ